MYWTRLVLFRPAPSFYSASPSKHHATGIQWDPNPDHYPDSEPASWSLTLYVLSAKQSRRTSNFNVFCSGIDPPTFCMPGEHSTTSLAGRDQPKVTFSKWPSCQSFAGYGLRLPQSPKFHPLSIYDQPFQSVTQVCIHKLLKLPTVLCVEQGTSTQRLVEK